MTIRKILLLTAALVLAPLSAHARAAGTDCLLYNKPATLVGTISMHKTHYDPRDFPSFAISRPYAVLTLDNPICASGPDDEHEYGVFALHIIDLTCEGERVWPRGSHGCPVEF